MNSLDLVNSVFLDYNQTCSRTGDCSILAEEIKKNIETIPRIQISDLPLEMIYKKIRDGDIIVLRLPTLFAYFHYLTVVYQHKQLFVFQQYGSYLIPITLHNLTFFEMIQDYVHRIKQSTLSDTDLIQLLNYEKILYGLSDVQIEELLDKEYIVELDHIIDRCEEYEPLPTRIRTIIKNKLETIPLWKDDAIVSSYYHSDPYLSISTWVEEYSSEIMKQMVRFIEDDLQTEVYSYIQEKLCYQLIELYQKNKKNHIHRLIKNRILRRLYYKNTLEQKDITEAIRYHINNQSSIKNKKRYSRFKKSNTYHK